MLVASEQARHGFMHHAKLKDINDMLANHFSEEDLQMMFSDMRFFFPDDDIYSKLLIFHELDIFKNEHN
jgi:hypothetical protein